LVDRCLEAYGEVFEEDLRPRVVLVGASHLRRLGKHLPDEKWNIVDLTVPGWRISATNVADMVRDLTDIMAEGTEDNTILVFHLLNNNIFQVKNVGARATYLARARTMSITSKAG
jgi:hypothetical protein